jgi:DNA-binding response OmpR family regulator
MTGNRTIRILLIEDDAAVRRMLARALSMAGYEVVSPSEQQGDGANGKQFDLIVTNTRVPYLSGKELVEEIHRDWPGIPILHLDDLTRPLSAALPSGVPSLMKPFSVESLLLAVEHLTSNRDRPGRGLAG